MPSTHPAPQYGKNAPLLESDCAADPFDQFVTWFDLATDAMGFYAQAMALGTVDASGQSHQRVVLLKAYQPDAFVFYTNDRSAKGQDMAHEPRVSLLFWWPQHEHQLRIEGVVRRLSQEDAQAYFQKRERASQIAASASPQSAVVDGSEALAALYQDEAHKWEESETIACPPYWGGYAVKPNYYEFWQGSFGRMHDRIVYRPEGDAWRMQRLAP